MSIGAQTKVKFNISQLTIAKLAQLGKASSGSQEVLGSILTGGNFLLNLFCSPQCKQYKDENIASVFTRKLA